MMQQKKTVKPLSQIKVIHSKQYARLLYKNQADSDLLDDIRYYCKQRSTIEKEYAQALQRLTGGFLAKKEYAVADKLAQESSGRGDPRDVLFVWRSILQEVHASASARLRSSECQLRFSNELKPIKLLRTANNKRIFEQLKSLQSDLAACVQEMSKSQKVYSEEEKHAHAARTKSFYAEEKIKRRSTNIFNSMAQLYKNHEKLATHLESCEMRSTSARNEYLFQLAAINAHLRHYFNKDVPQLAAALDGELYDKLREVLVGLSASETEVSRLTAERFTQLVDSASQVSRSFAWQRLATELMLGEGTGAGDPMQCTFQPCERDPVKSLRPPDAKSEENLDQIGRKLARRFVIRQRRIRIYEDEIRTLKGGPSTPRTPQDPPSSASAAAPSSSASPEYEDSMVTFNLEYVEQKLEELHFAIRREQIEVEKVDACLHLMRQAKVNVDAFVEEASSAANEAEKNAMAERERLRARMLEQQQQQRAARERSLEGGQPGVAEMGASDLISFDPYNLDNSLFGTYTGYTQHPPEPSLHSRDSASSPDDESSAALSDMHLHDYQNVNPGRNRSAPDVSIFELSGGGEAAGKPAAPVENGETKRRMGKDGVEEDRVEDWDEGGRLRRASVRHEFRAREAGQLDLVLHEEVALLEPAEGRSWVRLRSLIDGNEGVAPVHCLTLHEPPPQPPQKPSTDLEQIHIPSPGQAASPGPPSDPAPKLSPNFVENLVPSNGLPVLSEGDFVRTLVDYTGSDEDELTFVTGSVMRVTGSLSRQSVDDGWWEGDLLLQMGRPGLFSIRRGLFASMLVEPLPPDQVEHWRDIWEQAQLAIAEMNKHQNLDRVAVKEEPKQPDDSTVYCITTGSESCAPSGAEVPSKSNSRRRARFEERSLRNRSSNCTQCRSSSSCSARRRSRDRSSSRDASSSRSGRAASTTAPPTATRADPEPEEIAEV